MLVSDQMESIPLLISLKRKKISQTYRTVGGAHYHIVVDIINIIGDKTTGPMNLPHWDGPFNMIQTFYKCYEIGAAPTTGILSIDTQLLY